jgi:hypothetical protein
LTRQESGRVQRFVENPLCLGVYRFFPQRGGVHSAEAQFQRLDILGVRVIGAERLFAERRRVVAQTFPDQRGARVIELAKRLAFDRAPLVFRRQSRKAGEGRFWFLRRSKRRARRRKDRAE